MKYIWEKHDVRPGLLVLDTSKINPQKILPDENIIGYMYLLGYLDGTSEQMILISMSDGMVMGDIGIPKDKMAAKLNKEKMIPILGEFEIKNFP